MESRKAGFNSIDEYIAVFPGEIQKVLQAFKCELSIYEGGKGTVRFPIDEPLPLKLISKIVKFRVAENLDRWRSA